MSQVFHGHFEALIFHPIIIKIGILAGFTPDFGPDAFKRASVLAFKNGN
jgi:hypothetical protein